MDYDDAFYSAVVQNRPQVLSWIAAAPIFSGQECPSTGICGKDPDVRERQHAGAAGGGRMPDQIAGFITARMGLLGETDATDRALLATSLPDHTRALYILTLGVVEVRLATGWCLATCDAQSPECRMGMPRGGCCRWESCVATDATGQSCRPSIVGVRFAGTSRSRRCAAPHETDAVDRAAERLPPRVSPCHRLQPSCHCVLPARGIPHLRTSTQILQPEVGPGPAGVAGGLIR